MSAGPGPIRAPVFVAGGGTVAGRALLEVLRARGIEAWSERERGIALTDGAALEALFARERPAVIYAGSSEAGVAGNLARPASLMLDNLLAEVQVLGAAQRAGVRRLLYLASSCGYPRDCAQPMRPAQLFTGPVEPSSAPYATARLAGLVLCQAVRRERGLPWITAIPANPFGPGDDLDLRDAHVVAALMVRCWLAARDSLDEVVVWGSGAARRDLIFAPDLAEACLFLLAHYQGEEPVNIGSGDGVTVAGLAALVREVTGFGGALRFDAGQPEGAPVKLLDSGPLARLGWTAPTPLPVALRHTWRWVRAQLEGASS